jgi:hypothetical protein
MEFKFDMGQGVKDVITGFSGHVMARSQYLTGCNQYFVLPKMDKTGAYPDGTWVDENRLAAFGKSVSLNPASSTAIVKGGPAESYPCKNL